MAWPRNESSLLATNLYLFFEHFCGHFYVDLYTFPLRVQIIRRLRQQRRQSNQTERKNPSERNVPSVWRRVFHTYLINRKSLPRLQERDITTSSWASARVDKDFVIVLKKVTLSTKNSFRCRDDTLSHPSLIHIHTIPSIHIALHALTQISSQSPFPSSITHHLHHFHAPRYYHSKYRILHLKLP